ncbi:MAG: LamG domain-containing protein [Gammaproteobacteria bacterium]|nr:LamG domain-containing protein [Gammaproteobacteria bacterium]
MLPTRAPAPWCLALLCLLAVLAPGRALATYANATTAYDFVDPGAHTRITSWPGCSDKTGDDSLSAPIDIGFTFNFGGVDYTQLRVHTNGRLQFNNTACGYGTQSVGPPRTYTHPFPDAAMDRVMRVYGADLDLANGGSISYALIGTAPHRRFVVTWYGVGAWLEGGSKNIGAGTAYTYQIQLFEDGEFRYMYGDSDNVSEPSNTTLGPAQIGWQLSSADYKVVQTGLPANRSGLRFYIPAPIADYRFEQSTLSGATGEVLDSSGNGYHGTRIDAPVDTLRVTSVAGRVCRGINVPSSATVSNIDAIDSGLPVALIGNQGTITFWYRNAKAWTTENNLLLDAGTSTTRWFTFGKTNRGRLRFAVTDDAGAPVTADLAPTTDNAFAADTWVHLAVSWKLAAGSNATVLRIFLNGNLYGTLTTTTSGRLNAGLSTLYLGDGRTASIPSLGTAASANGDLDEVRVYNFEATQAVVRRDMAVTRTCNGIDHFALSHPGTAVSCEAAPVKLGALTAEDAPVTGYASTIDLSTSSGRGDWSLLAGQGTLDNGGENDGRASYRYVAGDGGVVTFGLRHTTVGVVNVDVTDGMATERSGAATRAEDADLEFVEAGFVFTANAVAGAIGTQIAGKPSATAPGAQALAVKAIRTATGTGACEAALVGTQLVDLAFQCVSPATCSGRSLAIDGGSATSIAANDAGSVGRYTPVKLEFDATGIAPFATVFDDAGSVRLHARFELPLPGGSGSGSFMTGASNVFVWRPFALDVVVPGNPAATAASGPRFLAAGSDFGADVRAVLWSTADDTNADGIADGMAGGDANPSNNARLSDNSTAPNFAPGAPFTLGATLFRPAGGRHPGLSGVPSASFASGIATVTGLRYDEVGIIEISAVQSGDYLGIGSAATAAIRGVSGAVGRFHPARFAIAANTPVFADACAAGAFSYLDETFHYATAPVLTFTARNAGGATTHNYTTSGFFKLGSTLAGRGAADHLARAIVHDTGADATVTHTTAGTGVFELGLPAGTGGDGFRYVRAAPLAPFAAAIDVSFPAAALQDDDAVCYDAEGDGACDVYRVEGVTGTTLRYGRLATDNVLGTELLPLTAPVRAEYHNGRGFVRNDADVCTVVSATAIDLGTGTPDTAPSVGVTSIAVGAGISEATIAHAPLASGLLGLSFSAPGAANVGELDYRVDLTASPWLRFDWNGDGTPEDPIGRTSFGLYAGPRSLVYQRDAWR